MPTLVTVESVTSFRTALRKVSQCLPEVRVLSEASRSLERLAAVADPPRMVDASAVEDATLRSYAVEVPWPCGFGGFLDGTQDSRPVAWQGPAPIVFGTVAAVVRTRFDRRLVTWDMPAIERRIYAPFAYVPHAALLQQFPGSQLRDTALPDVDGDVPPAHPVMLLERARNAVTRDREGLERLLAERWCAIMEQLLYVDGSLPVVNASHAVGVVKSHRTLYVSGAALDTVLGLRRGERSSVIRIAPRGRGSVHSWYLRVRGNEGRDALWGLVRVEVAESTDAGARADQVSRWVLAETAPNAMPDERWDTMAYGVRSCEEFLRTLTS